MSVLAIPTTPEVLTPAWLTEALRRAGVLHQTAVSAVERQVLGAGRGFTGCVVRLRLEYDGQEPAPASLVAKLPSPDPQVRAGLHQLGLYEREFRFYTQVAGAADLPIPRLYYADLHVDDGSSILLLEDLTQARTGDNLAGCPDEDLQVAVTQLARLQAAWWESPRLAELQWLVPLATDQFQAACQQLWGPFLARFQDLLPERLRHLGSRAVEHAASYRRYLSAAPRTIVHGDFRLDNLLFGGAGGAQVTILDWQLVSVGRGVADVAYLAAFCLPTEQRRALERQLVDCYHAALCVHGVRDYAADQCWQDYRVATLGALLRMVTAGALLDLSSERGRGLVAAIIERVDAALADHHVADLLPDGPEGTDLREID